MTEAIQYGSNVDLCEELRWCAEQTVSFALVVVWGAKLPHHRGQKNVVKFPRDSRTDLHEHGPLFHGQSIILMSSSVNLRRVSGNAACIQKRQKQENWYEQLGLFSPFVNPPFEPEI